MLWERNRAKPSSYCGVQAPPAPPDSCASLGDCAAEGQATTTGNSKAVPPPSSLDSGPSGRVLYSALEDDTPQYKAQRDLGGISNLCRVVRHWVSASHPCKIIISLPQLCQDYGSFSLTEKASLISTRTWDSRRIPSWGEHWMLQLRAGGQTALWFKGVKRHSVRVLWMWRPKSSAQRQGKQLSPAACSGCLGRQVKTKGLQAPLAKPPSTPKPWWPEPAMSHSCVT